MSEVYPQASKAVIYKDSKILIQHRDNKPEIFFPDKWGLFGGAVNKNESIELALIRELKEELNWEPDIYSFLYSWKDVDYNTLIHFFYVPLDISIQRLELNEGIEMKFFEIKDIKNLNMTPDLKLNLSKIIKLIDKCKE